MCLPSLRFTKLHHLVHLRLQPHRQHQQQQPSPFNANVQSLPACSSRRHLRLRLTIACLEFLMLDLASLVLWGAR